MVVERKLWVVWVGDRVGFGKERGQAVCAPFRIPWTGVGDDVVNVLDERFPVSVCGYFNEPTRMAPAARSPLPPCAWLASSDLRVRRNELHHHTHVVGRLAGLFGW